MKKERRMDVNFRKRLQQRFYYGEKATLDLPSLPLTELAVEYFREDSPCRLGHLDMGTASNIIRCNNVSPCSVVLSMMYAKRLRQRKTGNKELLQAMSSADLFFISMMMASKYLYDEGVDEEVFNDEWADNTDQDVHDVNQMEKDFLQAMDWKLFFRPSEFEGVVTAIEKRLASQEGLKRGWYTYTEMEVLVDLDLVRGMWAGIGSECCQLLSAVSAAYVTSLLSLVGSAALAGHLSSHLSTPALTSVITLGGSPHLASLLSGLPPPVPALSLSLGLMAVAPSHKPGLDLHTDVVMEGIEIGQPLSASQNQNNSGWFGESVGKVDSLHTVRAVGNNDSGQPESDEIEAADKSSPPARRSWLSVLLVDCLVSQIFASTSAKLKSFSNSPPGKTDESLKQAQMVERQRHRVDAATSGNVDICDRQGNHKQRARKPRKACCLVSGNSVMESSGENEARTIYWSAQNSQDYSGSQKEESSQPVQASGKELYMCCPRTIAGDCPNHPCVCDSCDPHKSSFAHVDVSFSNNFLRVAHESGPSKHRGKLSDESDSPSTPSSKSWLDRYHLVSQLPSLILEIPSGLLQVLQKSMYVT